MTPKDLLRDYTRLQSACFANVDRKDPATRDVFDIAKALFVRFVSLDTILKDAAPAVLAEDALYKDFQHALLPYDGTERDPLKSSRLNNHQLLRALCLLEVGRMLERKDLLARAGQAVSRYLDDINEDGIPEVEAKRGASAAWYMNTALMMTTTFLFRVRKSGLEMPDFDPERSLLVVKRQAAALERVIQAPELLHRYARFNMYPHPKHSANPLNIDLGFLSGFHGGRHYLAWIGLYAELAGETSSIPELFARHTQNEDFFPQCNDFIGGFLDVLLARKPDRPQS